MGCPVGYGVGFGEGFDVGIAVGLAVGSAVGVVGLGVGNLVGDAVGRVVGNILEAGVGPLTDAQLSYEPMVNAYPSEAVYPSDIMVKSLETLTNAQLCDPAWVFGVQVDPESDET